MRTIRFSLFALILMFLITLFVINDNARGSELTRLQIEQKIADSVGKKINFSNLDLSEADFSGLIIKDVDFFSSKLDGADFTGAVLDGANFTRTDLSNARFSHAKLVGAVIYAAILDNTDFNHANMTRCRIIGGGKSVKFINAILVEANLGADPANQGMVPVRAELPDSNFEGANLTKANFTHAVLNSANFKSAIITKARFDYAVLDGSNLSISE
jgi:uncharacterized protein YjbI with pentapeptide repeats